MFYGVHRSTIARAVGEVRPLLAARGFAVPGAPGLRLRTLADVFAYAAAQGVTLRIDGTEVQVRRPRPGPDGGRSCPARRSRTPSSRRLSATAGGGCCGWARSGPADHDVTALRTDGIEDLLRRHPDVKAEVNAGYQGLARDFPGQVSGPPKKPRKDAPPEETARWEQQRHQQSSQRICVEHAIAEPKQWRSLQRYLGRREYFQETALAVAGLVSDRAATR